MAEVGLPDWAVVTKKRRDHIERVATLLRRWAKRMRVSRKERDRWLRAAYFHDALKDASDNDLRKLWPDPAEPIPIRHGPAAAVLAERNGESDEGVLQAVRFHSVGYRGWDRVGRMLYLADFLEPGRRFRSKWRTKVAEFVPVDPKSAIVQVARERIKILIDAGWPIPQETLRFWNGLARES